MRCDVTDGPEALARRAADAVCLVVERKRAAVLGLASGATPVGLYAELAARVRAGAADLRGVTAFAVDELHGVPRAHPATNASYFARHLAGVPLRALHILDSEAVDPAAECARFRRQVEAAGGFDLVVLGIGVNGHIAFNEPATPFDSRAGHVALADSTRRVYAQAFGSFEATPAFGLTLGIADIVCAREVLLLASGGAKAEVVTLALEGPITEDVPASVLRKHAGLTVLLDGAAAARLSSVRT
jgi:glucosamine-6-phosphate deaminase